jgi:competence protein ComEC
MATKLSVTLIDVGFGDSIFIEVEKGKRRGFALIDSNDEPEWRSTEAFILRHLRTKGVRFDKRRRLFEFVMLSHAHSDHMSGLRRIIEVFGAKRFLYPLSAGSAEFAALMRYVRRSCGHPTGKVKRHQAINSRTVLPALGDVKFTVLWPPYSAAGTPYSSTNENDNSIVLGLSLKKVKLLLTGDCETGAASQVCPKIRDIDVFKMPHHGASNGLFDAAGKAIWLDPGILRPTAQIGMSTHVSPYGHPDRNVLSRLEAAGYPRGQQLLRTDHQYHLTYETKGTTVRVKHSRF